MTRAMAAIDRQFGQSRNGWTFRARGWLAPFDRPWIFILPWSGITYQLDQPQKEAIAGILVSYEQFLMRAASAALLLAVVPFVLVLWRLGLGNLSPLGFALALFGLWGLFSLVLTLVFVACGIDGFRSQLSLALAEARRVA